MYEYVYCVSWSLCDIDVYERDFYREASDLFFAVWIYTVAVVDKEYVYEKVNAGDLYWNDRDVFDFLFVSEPFCLGINIGSNENAGNQNLSNHGNL